MKKLFLLISLAALFWLSSSFLIFPASALLREHHQSPGVLRYHAQHSIKDRQQRAWQVILFPEDLQSAEIQYYLRLVGFPGLVEVNHPQPLEIVTSEGNILFAPDMFAQSSPASNVGQYDVTKILSQLSFNGSLKLVFSVTKPEDSLQDIALKIPQPILIEWQLLGQKYQSPPI